MIQTNLYNLHPYQNSEELHYYAFAVTLNRCAGSCNTLNGLLNKVFVPNKIEDLNLSVFNIITGIIESKTLTKHIPRECECKFDGRKCNSDQWWNKDKCRCESKKRHVCEKSYFWNPATCNCGNGKYLASIMNDLVITFDEIRESYKVDTDAEAESNDETKVNPTFPTIPILRKRKQSVKHKISIFYLHFY